MPSADDEWGARHREITVRTIKGLLALCAIMTTAAVTVLVGAGVLSVRDFTDHSVGAAEGVAESYRDVTGQNEELPLLPGVTVEIDDSR